MKHKRKRLNDYLTEHNPDFLLACQVHYYTLIRPNELSNIRLKDISLKDTGITDTINRVGLSVAKDQARHSSVATTNKYVRKELLTAHPKRKNFKGNLQLH